MKATFDRGKICVIAEKPFEGDWLSEHFQAMDFGPVERMIQRLEAENARLREQRGVLRKALARLVDCCENANGDANAGINTDEADAALEATKEG